MDWLCNRLFFSGVLLLAAAINGVRADTMVTGTVFCDQCKDGERSLFDYPLYGVKVTMACPDGNGQMTIMREETTNWFGNYAMRFDGTPDLSSCRAQVSGSTQGPTGCGFSAGPTQNPRLMFRMFDMEMYVVDSLLSQPPQPMSFCPRAPNPAPPNPIPGPVTPARPRWPPMPRLPPVPPLPPLPPTTFFQASACPYENWTMPEYRCYWRVNPDTKVAVAFGPMAASRYGTDMTLWSALQGRGDPYRTLLREGTAALLNSYDSIEFAYHTLGVIHHMNWALVGSPQQVLLAALRFKRANSGYGHVSCKFTPCK